jgi:phage I-like protein
MLVLSFQTTLPDAAGNTPEWIHLVPAGKFKGVDGRGPFHLKDPRAVMAASEEKLVLDENHSTDLAAPQGGAAPARGWIVELQSREDGLWGHVEWTESGKQLQADKAYRAISPVFDADPRTGEVLRILRASLTNNPNLTQLETLHHQETGVDLKQLRAIYGLPDDADEAAVFAAARAGKQAVTELQTRGGADHVVEQMAAKVRGLETELGTLKSHGARVTAETYIDGAIAKGKPIVALRDHYIARHMANPSEVEKEVTAMVSINAGGMPRPERNDANDDDELTQEEMAVCKKMGQDPKKFAQQRNEARKRKQNWGNT